MYKKQILIIFILISFLFAIPAISATNIDDLNQTTSIQETDILNVSEDSPVLGDGEGSFSDLQSLIDVNSEVILDRNYKFDSTKDVALKEGIKLNKTITISGNNVFSIDGDNQARIFDITGNNVILKDIILINSKSDNNGGAISITAGSGAQINNVTISNSKSGGDGGAIYLAGTATAVQLKDIKIDHASADRYGGGIYTDTKVETWNDLVDFNTISITYSSAVYGGAFFLNSLASANNFEFNHNRATQKGGAIYFNASYPENMEGYLYNSTFINNTAQEGGALYLFGSNGGFKNITFISNTATGSSESTGGAMSVIGTNWKIVDGYAFNNTASGDGGGVYWTGNKGLINNLTFIKNSASYIGGAVFFDGTVNTTIQNSRFFNNTAGTNGGALDWSTGSNYCNLINSTFTNNTAARSGGAIYVRGDYVSIYGSDFNSNEAYGTTNIDERNPNKYTTLGGNGGAIIYIGSYGYVENSTFTENVASKSGGAIYLQRNTNTTFKKTRFIKNNAGVDGGAIDLYEHAQYAQILDSWFVNNTAGGDGGAVNFATGSSNAYIYNTTFDYNIAKRNGGALSWEGTEGKVSYCNFSYNKATGETLLYDMTLTMENIIVVNNTLPEASQSTQNKLYILDKSANENNITFVAYVTVKDGENYNWLLLKEINIVNDTAPSAQDWGIDQFFGGDGGSILWSGNVATIDHCVFIGSESARRGGGAYMTGGDNVTFSNCHFENGTSGTNGGGVDWLAGANYGKLINCTFIHNNAVRSAGAIYYDGDYGEFTNVTIIDNYAHGNIDYINTGSTVKFAGWDTSHWDTNTTGGDGGAIMLTGSHIVIYNVTFVNNTAVGRGGAVFLQDNENVRFELCKFINNTALGTALNTFNDDKDLSSGLNMLFTGHGGAIAFDVGADDGEIISCTFVNNTAALDGGAINFATGSSNAYIYNSTFDYNTAHRNGGALCWEGTEGRVSYCNFTYNRATGEFLPNGMSLNMEDIIIVNEMPVASSETMGKLYILDTSVSANNITFASFITVEDDGNYNWLLLEETNIVNDTAPSAQDWGLDRFFGGDGGAILWSGNVATIDHCIFIGSESARRGGGAYMTGGDNVTFSNCHFENGTSGTNGGGVDWLAGANYGKLINCTFIHNNATRSAGAIYYDGDYGEFRNVIIIDNHAHGNMDQMHSLNGVNFAGWDTSHWDTNTTGGDGGAIMLTGSHIVIYNVTFENNSAVGRGGAVFIQDNQNVTFELCKFINNTALGTAINTFNDDKDSSSGLNMLLTGHGGAIAFDIGANDGEIISCTFVNNTAALDGGAINFATGSTNAYIYNSTFDYNTAHRNGGALCWEGTEGRVSYCNFTYNRATGEFLPYGMSSISMEDILVVNELDDASGETMGKLYILDTSVSANNITFASYITVEDNGKYEWLLLEKTNIVNDTAPSAQDWGLDRFFGGDGGAILWSGNVATIDHCIFIGSESARRGGGAYMTGGDNVTFSNCHFENGTSGTNGGGVDWLAGANYGKLINCTFIHNNAARSAGAIYYDGDYGEFTNITVIDNRANGGLLKNGRVNYAGWDTSHWDTNTTGGDAGSLMITGDHIRLYNATFINNTAVGRGGAVFLQDNTDVVFDLCTFKNNIALGTANNTYNDDKNLSSGRNILHTGNGGAIAFDVGASEGYILNSYFFNNTAARNGGAVSFFTGSSNATIFNSRFDNNTAYRSGGAFFWDGINGNVSYCNFSYNKALGTALEYDMVLTYENIEVVDALPASGVSNKLYIVDLSNETTTVYKSYVVDKDGSWLLLDQTEIVDSAPSAKDWGMDQFFGGNGGTILWGGDVGVIDHCNFWYSESARRGGGAYMRGSDNVTVSNSYFENCTSGTNGGGLDWLAGANYGKVINSTFVNTRAARSAGAIYYDGDYGEMTNIVVIGTQSYGGSLTESYDGKVKYAGWDSSHWDTNTTGGDAGAIMITGDHVYMYNASFTDCISVGRGGAIFLQDNENITIDSSTFTNNKALGTANNTWADYTLEHDESSPATQIDLKLTGHGGAVAFDVGAKNCAIINSEFTENNARRDGGAVNFAVGALNNTIKDSIFTDNYVYDDGGAINWEGNGGLIENITCYANIGLGQGGSTSKGGTISITGSNVTITKSSFTLGSLYYDANAKLNETDGGAIFVTGNNVNITDSTFDSCTSPHNAGAINIIGNNTLIDNCTFIDCDAAEHGGAIYVSGLYAKIVNSSFRNSEVNKITGLGGSIYITGNYATIFGSEFDSSSAFQGGTIFVEGDNCNISNSSFANSFARDGGAIYSTGSYSGVYYSNFTANEAEYDGGGIYWYGGKDSKYNSVIGCIFTNNIAYAKGATTNDRTTFGGGGLYWSEGGLYGTLRDSQFYNNSVQSTQKADGGAVLWDKSSHGIIDNCTFEGNYITSTYSVTSNMWVQGGTLFLRAKSNFTISNCEFINSSSTSEAGAMYLSNTNPISPVDILIINTRFTGNVAKAVGTMNNNGGGAIQIKEASNVKFVNVTFDNNVANHGGALSIISTKGKLEMYDCVFTDNNATNFGGSIYTSADSKMFYIYDSVIANNTAANGGGMYVRINFTSNNVSFINNTATENGGGMYVTTSGATISNINMTGNKAYAGSAIYLSNKATLTNMYLIENQATSHSLQYSGKFASTKRVDVTFRGRDNLLNAIYQNANFNLTVKNVTFWDAEGINNTGDDPIILQGNWNPNVEAGQNITVSVFDGDGILLARQSALTDRNGKISMELSSLIPDVPTSEYNNIYIESEVDDTYYTYLKITSRESSEIAASANKTRYHENTTVNVTVTTGATGKVSVYLNDTFLGNITLSNYKGSIDISTLINGKYLPVGNHELTFIYNGNAKYDVSNTTAILEITKTDSIVLINATPMGYNVFVNVTVLNGDIDTVSNTEDITGHVTVNVGQRTIVIDLVNGTGMGEIYNLPKGEHTVEARYSGDSNYEGTYNSTDVEITENVRTFINIEVNAEDIMVDETIQVNVTIISADNSPVDGNITIFLDNVEYILPLNNSKASFNKTGLSAGYKLVAVIFEGNEDLAPSSGFGSFIVHKYDAFVNINVNNITYATDDVINITVPSDAEGNVYIVIKGSEHNYEYGMEINNGTILVPMAYFGIDEYNITVSFEDDRYKLTTNSSTFSVIDKSPSAISINVTDITVGDDLIVHVNVTENATGKVNIIIAGHTYTATLNDSKANFTVSNLIARNYHITAQYLGDIYYYESTVEADFTVNKKNAPLNVKVTNSTVGSVEYINVTVDDNATGYVLINIDGVHYYDIIENGVAQFNITGLLIGNYTIEVTYMGDDNYTANSTTAKLSITKIPVLINVTSHDIIVDQMETLTIKTSENITALITVEINGVNQTTFINEGIGSLILTDLSSGAYNVTVYYAGDDEFLPVSNITNFTVRDKYASKVTVNVSDITIGETLTVRVNVTDGATGTVTIILAGGIYTVDLADGEGSVDITDLIARDYHVTAIYNGDGNFTTSQTEASFKVNKKEVSISVMADNITVGQMENITVTITDGTTGVVLININGIDYFINITAGQYELKLGNLAVGNYTVDVSYIGDNYYTTATNSTKFKVEKITPAVTLEVTQGKIAAYGENVAIKLTGPSDVTGVANVYLTLNGITDSIPYAVYINNGVGYLTIEKPSVGNYNVSGVYLENYKYISLDSNNDTFEVYMNGSSIDVHAHNIKVGENETIKVTFPKGEFAGDVTIFVGETEYSAPIVFNGTISTATLNVTGLSSGLYIVTASFAYTNETAGTTIVYEGSTSFTVDKITSALTIDSIEDIRVGENVTIKLNISPEDITGDIDVYINGEKYSVDHDNLTLIIPDLASAHYNVQAFYLGDSKYLPSNASATFNVFKNNITLSLNVSDIDVGSVEYINVTLQSDAKGYVLISVNDTNYYAEIIDGVAKVTINDIGVGSYIVTATFLGDDKYDSNSTTGSFTVSKLKTGIEINGSNIIVGHDELLIFNTTDDLTVVVILDVNGTNYTSFVRNGKGNFTLSNLKEGKYTVKIYFNGDDKYEAVSNQTTFNVTGKSASAISINVSDITIGSDLTVYVNVTENATGEVVLVIAGNTYTATLNNSKANFTVSNLIARNYHITAQYLGDEYYLESNNAVDFTVNKKNTPICVNVTNSTVGSVEYINVTVDKNATGYVLINIEGVHYYDIIENGVAQFNITGLLIGNYTIEVTYMGDDNYTANSTTAKLSITKIPVLINVTSHDIIVDQMETLTIKTSENITALITVEINGVNQTTFINEGIGSLILTGLSSGSYNVTVYYAGDDEFLPVSNITNFTVRDKYASQITVNVSDITIGETLIVKVNVTEGATGTVTIILAGGIYTVDLTDSEGSVDITGLIARDYHVTAIYNGDGNFKSSQTEASFKVNKKNTPIGVNVTNSTVGSVEYINVTVDENATGYVLINIDGVHYYDIIENGVAQFEITGLLIGNYTIEVTYMGDDNYTDNSTTAKLSITKIPVLINVTSHDIIVDQMETLTIKTSENITALITVEINGVNQTTFINEGIGSLTVSGLNSGSYNVTVYYAGDDEFLPVSNVTNFTVRGKYASQVSVNVSDITIGDNLTVRVNVTEGATGTVTVILAGDMYTVDLADGRGSVNITGLIARDYHVTAIYNGDGNFTSSQSEAGFKVNKKNTPICVNVTNSTVGSVEYINVTVDDNATGYVLINIEGVHYYDIIENGVAQFEITGLLIGNYTIEVTYMGDDNYSVNSTTADLSITKIPVTMNITSHDIIVDQMETLTIRTSENITALVTVEINGVNQTTFINEGIGSLILSSLSSGSYNVTVYYEGDDEFLPVSNVTNFTVRNKSSSQITVNVSDITIGETLTVKVNVTDGATGTVTIILAGDIYTVDLTNGEGSVDITGLIARDYHVTAIYNGDENFTTSQDEGSFKVNKKDTAISVEAGNITVGQLETITVNITDGTTGVVLININGIDYFINITAGQYELKLSNLTVGNYTVDVAYIGDSNYGPAANATNFKVEKITPEVTLEVTQGKIAAYGENVAIKLTGPEDVTGIAHIYLTLDGITDPVPRIVYINKGVGYLTIEKPSVGKYNVSAVYLEDYKYVSVNYNNDTFEVYMNGSSINVHAQNIKVGDNETIKVTFPQGEFTGNVTIFVGEVKYSAPIVFDGTTSTATLNVTGLASGLYIVTASFAYTNETAGTTIVYEGSTSFTVDKIASALTIDSIADITVGDNITIKLNISPNDAKGDIDVYVNGEKYTVSHDNPVLNLSNLASAHYNVQAFYQGDDKYLPSNASTAFNVFKNNIDITLNVSDIDVDCVEYINVTLENDAKGYVLISVNDTNYYAEIIDGFAKVSITDISVGTYLVKATFIGDDKYESNSTTGTFTVSKLKTGIEINASDIIVGHDELLIFNTTNDLTVVVILDVNGTNYTSFVRNGKGNFTLTNLKEGTYTAKIFFNGDDKYEAVSNETTFNVIGKSASAISINVSDITIGSDLIVYVNVTENTTGEVVLVIAGNTYTATLNNSKANFTVPNLIARNYHITAKYNGDENYLASENTADFVVNKKTTEITADVTNSTVGSVEYINVTLDENATGSVLIKINGTNYYAEISQGVAKFNITGLLTGSYEANVTYSGDDNFKSSTINVNLTVSKLESFMSISSQNVTVGEDVELIIIAPQNITAVVHVEIDGKNYTTFLQDGKGNLTVRNLPAKDYTATVYYSGDYEYINVTNSTKFTVYDKKQSQVNISVESIYVGEDAVIYVNVTSDATGQLVIVLAGNLYNETLSEGKAKFTIPNLIARNYHVTVQYNGDKYYYGSTNSTDFVVNKKKTSISANVTNSTVGDTEYINVGVDENATGYVLINISGSHYYGDISKGIARFNITGLLVGNYTAYISYVGDDKFNATALEVNLTVSKIKTLINITSSDITLGQTEKFTIRTSENITDLIYVEIDGANYTTFINNGIGTFETSNLTAKEYTVTVYYKGDDRYFKAQNITTFTVSAKKESEISVNVSDITVGENAIVYVNVTEGAEGAVTIVIAGNTYSKELIGGKANFTVHDLIARNYHVTAIYEGNAYYLNSTGSCNFTVNKKNTPITVNVTNSTVGDVEYINVTVDGNASGYVLISIEGVNYYGIIENGVAKFNITGLLVGNHNMNVTYIGDSNYNLNTTACDVNIAQKTTLINITAENITVGGVVTLIIQTSGNITDLVTVEINGVNHTTFIDDGYGILEVHNLANDTYTAIVYYAGSYEYEKIQNQTVITVYDKKHSQVNITVESIYVGEDLIVNVNVTENATGQIVVIIAGNMYNQTLDNGKAKFTIPDLIARNYHVTVQYTGDDNYYGSTNATDFAVNKKDTSIDTEVTNSTVGSIEYVKVTVNVNATGTILLSVNGSNYYERIADGVARFNITGLLVGNYTAYITYIGDDRYNENVTQTNISISKKSTLINITGADITIGANEELIIKTSENITALLKVTIGEDEYSTFISEGIGKLVVYGLSNGTYTATVYYAGDDEYIAVNNFTTFEVGDKKSSAIDLEVESITVGEDLIIEVNVTENATGYVSLVIAGTAYKELLNDSKATFNISGLIARDYHITVDYLGDDNYYGSENTASFTVNKKKSEISVNVSDITVGETVELRINITNGTTGVVLIDINGTDYYAIIDDGYAVLTVDNLIVGNYNVTVEYEGDANYDVSTANVSFKVTKLPSEITVKVTEGKVTAYGNDVVIEVTGKADVTGVSIVQLISGDNVFNYTVYINKGVGTLIIKPDVGHYTVSAIYEENGKYLSNVSNVDSFEVYDNGGSIGVITDNIDVGQTENITILLSGEFTGIAYIYVDNKTYEVILTYNETSNTSSAIQPVVNLAAREYTVLAEYNHTEGDKTVLYTGTSKFTVNKLSSEIAINEIESIKVGENVTITFSILPGDATGNISVYINGVKYETDTGNLTLVVEGLQANEYYVQATYDGDSKYLSSQATSEFKVEKNNLTIELNVESINVGDKEIINVTVNKDATGYVLINISGTHYYAEITEGLATVTVNDLTAGTYSVNATFIEDDKYLTNSAMDEFTVSKLKTGIEIAGTGIVFGQDETLTFKTSDDLTVVVIIEIDGNNYTSFVSEGKGNFTIANPAVGPHTVKIYFNGNDKYESADNVTSFEVTDKKASEITISVENITVGENATVKVNITSGATGNVTIVIRGNEYTKKVDENGVATFSIPELIARDYEVTAIYAGDTYYTGSSAKADFTVKKIESSIDLNVTDIVMGDTEVIDISVTEGASGLVLVNISGTCYYGELENSKATIKVDGLKTGEYEAIVTYVGNDQYNESTNSKSFTVQPQITVESVTNDGNNTQITVKVSDNSTGEVTVIVNGTPYTAKVENGTATVNVNTSTPGDENITVIYKGDGQEPTEQNKTITIPKVSDYDMSMNITDAKLGENATVTVKVPSDATGNVTLTVNNQTLTSEIKDGVATFTGIALDDGFNSIAATYPGDSKYASNNIEKTIYVDNNVTTINAVDPLVRGWNSQYDYEAVFTDEFGEMLDNVTVTFIVDGKSYEVKTEKGIAKLTTAHLSIGEYNVTSINPVTGEKITTHLSIVPRLIQNRDINMDFADGTYYTVLVIDDDGTPVGKGEIVSITANGIHYVAETDANGYAKLKINLNPKTYTLDAKYKDYKVSNKLVVKQTLKLVKKTIKVKKGKKLVLKAKLKWSNGKAIKGKKIVFKFRGKKYSAKTNKKGIAKVTIKKKVTKKLKKGKKYKFTAKYLTNTVKGKVKVKK